MSPKTQYVFRGEPGRRYDSPHPDSPKEPEPYLASPDLVQAVNLAIYLGRPLLVEGEAGCGKTRLARAVAYELGLPFYAWYVRSTSKAQEGLYSYDAILRLHDVQTHRLDAEMTGADQGAHSLRDPRRPEDYRRLGPLGRAFAVQDRPAVLLIDEIDKADIDFPNDLLAVLDEWEFDVPETGEKIVTQHKPIVIITSNKEKGNLPAPFLRRCIYFYITFPADRLKKIVEVHYQGCQETAPTPAVVNAAVESFLRIRQDAALHKLPGTSEFLDWLEAVRGFRMPGAKAPKLTQTGPVPYPGLLFKMRADWGRYTQGR